MSLPAFAHVDRERLNTDVLYRVQFDRDFVEFTKEDEEILHAAAPLVLPITMEIVDGVYEHLFMFSNTKEVFLKREEGYEGELAKSADELTLDHPQILLRKKFLTLWLAKIMTANFESPEFWQYLDAAGSMHTGRPAFKHRLNKAPLIVSLQYLSLTLAWIQDVFLTIVMNIPRHELSSSRKLKILRAFNKIIAIQQDLFQRHYVRNDEEAAADLAKWQEQAKATGEDGAADLSGKMGGLKVQQDQKAGEAGSEEEELSKADAKEATDALPEVTV
ncbi:hypothetical protein JCM11641_000478 [Rhodosporidiobolus odoratus]